MTGQVAHDACVFGDDCQLGTVIVADMPEFQLAHVGLLALVYRHGAHIIAVVPVKGREGEGVGPASWWLAWMTCRPLFIVLD